MSSLLLETLENREAAFPADVGPCLCDDGVIYRVWALGHHSVRVHVETPNGRKDQIKLEQAKSSGYFYGIDPEGKAGDLYKISIDGAEPIPDLVSHYQPKGVLGPSMVIDSRSYVWKSKKWRRPPWNGHVIYECHIGTLTKEGTFRSAIERLDYLEFLGVTALELMPVAEWAERNWGYDGTMLFAQLIVMARPMTFAPLLMRAIRAVSPSFLTSSLITSGPREISAISIPIITLTEVRTIPGDKALISMVPTRNRFGLCCGRT